VATRVISVLGQNGLRRALESAEMIEQIEALHPSPEAQVCTILGARANSA